MFRFNWPTSELLFGQYFSMFCEYYSEMAEDGPLQMTGTPTARLAQIRFTQKFLGDWTVAGLIGDPTGANLDLILQSMAMPVITTGSMRKAPRSRGRSPMPTTSGARPLTTANPSPSRPRSWPAGSVMSCGGSTVAVSTLNGPNNTGFFRALMELPPVRQCQRPEPVCQPLVVDGQLVHPGHPD